MHPGTSLAGAAKNPEHNSAVLLKEYLERKR
jgi:hypothetical protein